MIRQAIARRSTAGRLVLAAMALALIPGVFATGLFANGGAMAAEAGLLPDGSTIPESAMLAPASVSTIGDWLATPAAPTTTPAVDGPLAPGVVVADDGADTGGSLLGLDDATQSTTADQWGIPPLALAAYQRAQTVINAADPGCRLPWELLAAIGRVESDHGQYGGSQIGAGGAVTPPIIGIALDGTSGTSSIADTDDGSLDDDRRWDRAVGPMQFIPSTWSAVGVDADGDAIRNPQDIDDAALAAAVYLCSGSSDLSTTAGQRTAIYRYNHSNAYVALVLSIMSDYGSTGVSTVPTTFPAPTTTVPAPAPSPSPTTESGSTKPNKPKPKPSPPSPSQPAGNDPNRPPLPTVTPPPVGTVLSAAEAAAQCTREGKVNNPLRADDAFDQCVADYTS